MKNLFDHLVSKPEVPPSLPTGFFESNVYLAFAILLLSGIVGGLIAKRVRWLPTITAFMMLGFAIGPYGMGIISSSLFKKSWGLTEIALGMILFNLGTMLDFKTVLRSRSLVKLSISESVVTFAVVTCAMLFFGQSLLVAALLGAIAVSASPAVLLHVAHEVHADGFVTEQTRTLMALNNVLSFGVFTAILPFALVDGTHTVVWAIALPFYQLAASCTIGIGVAWITVRFIERWRDQDGEYLFPLLIGSLILTLGLANLLHASMILAALVMGIAVRGFEGRGFADRGRILSQMGFRDVGEVFLILFFVMAGAKIDPARVQTVLWAALGFVAVRSVSKIVGVFLATPRSARAVYHPLATGLLLVPMAGMAIGLSSIAGKFDPDLGDQIGTLVFTTVAILETVGPFVTVYGLRLAGEIGHKTDAEH